MAASKIWTRTAAAGLALLAGTALSVPTASARPARAGQEAPTMTIEADWESDPMLTYHFGYIDGQLTPATATPIARLQRFADGVWRDISSARVDPQTGSFRLSVLPHTRGTLRLRARSSGGRIVSNEITVRVIPMNTEIRYVNSYPKPSVSKEWITVQGQVFEYGAVPTVVVQRRVNGRWEDRQSGPVDPKTGFFRIPIRPSSPGVYELRVRTPKGSRWSETSTVTVDPAPIAVPTS